MRRGSFRDQAVVIRSHDFGEADRVVVLLTRTHGIVRSVAKGVRKARSRFGSRLQPFVHLDVQLYPGRNLATLTSADTVAYYGAGIIEDYDRYTAASAVLETAERIGSLGEDPSLFDAVTAALATLRHTVCPTAALDAFLLQAMATEGWAPSLFDCAACQAPGPHHAFHPGIGGAACLNCRPSGSAEIDEQVLHLMWLLAGGHTTAAEEIVESEGGLHLGNQAHQLTVAHLQWHLETTLASLKVMQQR